MKAIRKHGLAILPKAICRFNVIPIKLPMAFFTELEQIIQKFIWIHKRQRIAQAILRKTNKAGGTPGLQTILQSYSNQNSMVLAPKQTYGSMEQNREPRNKPTHLWSINLRQRRQGYTMGKKQSLQQVVLKSWTTAGKSMKLERIFTPYTKINSK